MSPILGCYAVLLSLVLAEQTLKPGRVEGVVTSQVSGQPVKKANVRLMGDKDGTQSATSDASGQFHFDRVIPGSYRIYAECPGYGGNGPEVATVKVSEEQEIKNVAVKLLPMGVVSGRVLDENGEPMMHVAVTAFRYFYFRGRKQLQQGGFAQTNDLGQFQMIDVAPGKYFFEASAAVRFPSLPGRTVSTIREQAYPPAFYPNATDVSQAAASEVKPGVELGNLEFHLKPKPAYHIRGMVGTAASEESEARGPNVGLRLERVGNVPFRQIAPQARVLPDGTFDIAGVVDGAYILIAARQDGPNAKVARQAVNVGGKDVEGIALSPATGADLQGTLTIEGPVPVPPAVTQNSRGGGIHIFLEDVGESRSGSRGFPIQDGRFLVHAMQPAPYLVNVTGDLAGKYVKSIQFNDQDVRDARIDLTNQGGGALRIVLGADSAQVHGTVMTRAGAPAAGILVTIAPPLDQGIRPDLCQATITDPSGNFQFGDLAPIEYRVFAWEEKNDNIPVTEPEFLKQFESNGARVHPQPNGKESVQTVMIPAAEIEAAKEKLP